MTVWLGQTAGTLAVTRGFIPTACTGFWGTHSLWMDTLRSLDIVGRALDLSQSNVPYALSGVDVGGVGEVCGGSGRRGRN